MIEGGKSAMGKRLAQDSCINKGADCDQTPDTVMSLTNFIKRPAIRNAFKALAIKERTPNYLLAQPLLVSDAGGPRGLTGTTFDYVARVHLARELQFTRIKVFEGKWAADQGAKLLESFLALPDGSQWWMDTAKQDEIRRRYGVVDYKPRWRNIIPEARAEAQRYIQGLSNLRRFVELAQYLAQLDLIYRARRFDPDFRPIRQVTEEVLQLLDLFDPLTRWSPGHHCFLNPSFTASERIGGADADLIVDDRLIELKTTIKPSVLLDQLLQLSCYVALQQLGGIPCAGYLHRDSIETVEIYFARHAQHVSWRLKQLFPADGFDRFCAIFNAELATFEHEREAIHPLM